MSYITSRNLDYTVAVQHSIAAQLNIQVNLSKPMK